MFIHGHSLLGRLSLCFGAVINSAHSTLAISWLFNSSNGLFVANLNIHEFLKSFSESGELE